MGNDLHREHKVIPHSLHKLQTIKWNQLKKQNKKKRKSKHNVSHLDEYGDLRIVNSKYWNHDTISAISSTVKILLSSSTISLPELATIVVHGIPFDHRHSLWKHLVHFDQIRNQHRNPNAYYQSLLDSNANATVKCRGHSTILIDIPRTFSNHNFFKLQSTKSALHNVLTAFSMHQPDIGYVQGLNYIVSLLLFHYNEQDTFWMLCALIRKFHLDSYYHDDMESIQKSSGKLGQSIEHRFPKLSRKLQKAGVLPVAFATPYFLTIFTYNLPLAICARFWDLLICSDVLFHSQVTVEQLISEFVLLYIELKRGKWKKSAPDKLMAKLRTIEVEEYEMAIMIQHIIDSHPLQQNELPINDTIPVEHSIVPLEEGLDIAEEQRLKEKEYSMDIELDSSICGNEMPNDFASTLCVRDEKENDLASRATQKGQKLAIRSKSFPCC